MEKYKETLRVTTKMKVQESAINKKILQDVRKIHQEIPP